MQLYSAADIMDDIVKVVFEADLQTNVTAYRQHLQTAFVEITASIINPKNASYDNAAKNTAMDTLKKIKTMLSAAISVNKETKAHRDNLQFIITKALKGK